MCPFFCIPKSGDGLFRPIVNLRPLNRCIRYENLKMENLNSVRSLLRKGDFMVKIDLKDILKVLKVENKHMLIF